MQNFGIIIPVFNVAATIEKVLASFSREQLQRVGEILVIDNASSDGTVEKINAFFAADSELRKKLTVMRHESNYGYGCSIKGGFEYFLKKDSITHIMILHGDYQANPYILVKNFFHELDKDPSLDMVLASRFTSQSNISEYSRVRTFGNYFFNVATHLATGIKMSDAGSAIMFVRKEALRKIPVTNLSNSWHFHPQLNILLFGNRDLKIKEIPMDWADSEVKSSIKLVSYGIELLSMLMGYFVAKRVLGKPVERIFAGEELRKDRQFVVYGSEGKV